MYLDTEIKGHKLTWVMWLSMFKVGEKREADYNDRSKLAVSISNNFHKHGIAKFKTYVETVDKVKHLFVERIN